MSNFKSTRILSAIAALAIGFAAPAALAQTSTMAPTSTMKPVKVTKSKTTTVAPSGATSTTTTTTVAKSTGGLATAQKFTTAAAAQASCPTDTVVWSTLSHSKTFHMSTSKYFGKTKHGAYVCSQAATTAGYHQSKV